MLFANCRLLSYADLYRRAEQQLEEFVAEKIYPGNSGSVYKKEHIIQWRAALDSVHRREPGVHRFDVVSLTEDFLREEWEHQRFSEVEASQDAAEYAFGDPPMDVDVNSKAKVKESVSLKDELPITAILVCARCSETEGPCGEELMKCARCSVEVYCSKECQRK